MTLEDRLDRLANRTPPGDPADILAAARVRARRAPAPGAAPGRLRVAAAVVAVVALAGGAMTVLGNDGGTAVVATGPNPPDTSALDAIDEQSAVGPTVRVEAAGVPTLGITTTPLQPSDASESGGWLDHTVTMENTGPEPVYLNDFRTGTMLGDREVAVATDGCGYGSSGDQPVSMGCRSDYRPVTIEAGGTHTFTVTLWRELAGMNPVTAGAYRWDIEIHVAAEPFADPRAPAGKVATATVHYNGLADADTGTHAASPVPAYDLGLPGAGLVEDNPHTAVNTDVVLWSDGRGAYMSLTVRPGRPGLWATPGAGATFRDETFPEAQGEAWFSDPKDPSAATMWWVRPSGDLWLLNGYWYGNEAPESPEDALRDWALGMDVEPAANPPYVAGGTDLVMVGYDRGGDLPSRSRVWRYEGHEIVLLVNEGSSAAGRSNLLAGGAPTVDDVPSLGEVWSVGLTYGWAVARPKGAWATLTVPDGLAREAEDILMALRPADH